MLILKSSLFSAEGLKSAFDVSSKLQLSEYWKF